MNIPKFRVWVVAENRMIENVGLLPDGRVILVPNEEFDSEKYAPHFFNLSDLIDIYEKSEIILMQSTGLTDSKGVEIFEGDICSHKYTRCPILVEYDQLNGFSFGDVGQFDSFTVIGNIHAKKELLNEQ